MPLDFPNTPTDGQIFNAAGVSWLWDGTKWTSVLNTSVNASTGITNVKAYGAVGNGVTDDTVAIRSAVAVGGDVYFPSGTYVVTGQPIVVPNNTRLHGAGPMQTTIKASMANFLTVPTVFCNMLYTNPGPFDAPSTTPTLQTDGRITIEEMGFDSSDATLRFLLARELRFRNLRFVCSNPANPAGGIGIVGCDDVVISQCDFLKSFNPIDCWQGATRIKVDACFMEQWDSANNGGCINFNAGGTTQKQSQSSNDLQVVNCTFWTHNSMAAFLDSFGNGSACHTMLFGNCTFVAKSGSGNSGIVGRGLGGNVTVTNCIFHADPGAVMGQVISLGGYYGGAPTYVAAGIVTTTSGSPQFTVSVPNGTDLGPGNWCLIDNNAGGAVVGNGMSLNGWYLVTAVSGTSSNSSSGTLLTCKGPNNATASGVIAGTTRQQGFLGCFSNCQISDITMDNVGDGHYAINVAGSGHRIDGVTMTQNYYLGSPQYVCIIQFDSTADYGNPNWVRTQISNIIGAAGTGSLPGGWGGDNVIAWQPYSALPDMPLLDVRGNGGVTIGGFVWGQAGPMPRAPANGLVVAGPIQIGNASGPTWTTGSAVPASVQPVGSLYSRVSTWAAGATLYVSKGGGAWTAVAGV